MKTQALAAPGDRDGQVAVLDINVLMHYHEPVEICWAKILGTVPAPLVLLRFVKLIRVVR